MKRNSSRIILILFIFISIFALSGCVDEIVVSIEAEENMSMVFCDSGKRYLWGSNSAYRANTDNDQYLSLPEEFTLVDGVIDFAAGDTFVSWLTGDGFLMSGEMRFMPTNSNSRLRPELPVLIESQNDGIVAYRGDSESYTIKKINETLRDVEQVVAGAVHTIVLKSNGTVWGWGPVSSPERIGALEGIASIATSSSGISAALDLNGNVWTWQSDTVPEMVLSTGNIIQVDCSDKYWNALDSDGHVWVWCPSDPEPVILTELEDIINFSSGAAFTAALDKSGNVWTWGSQIGDFLGRETDTPQIPGTVKDLDGIIAISSGAEHVLALRKDGTVWAWGSNNFGQLGDGTTESTISPIKIEID